MRIFRIMAFVFLALTALAPTASAQGLCREACYVWCKNNRPTDSCRADCAGRQTCAQAARERGSTLRGKACFRWCDQNRSGSRKEGCYADCRSRS